MSYQFKVGDKGKCYSDGQYEVLAIRDGKLVVWCEWYTHKIAVMVRLDGTYLSNHTLQYIYPPKVKKWLVKYHLDVGLPSEQYFEVVFINEQPAMDRYRAAVRSSAYSNVSIKEIEE